MGIITFNGIKGYAQISGVSFTNRYLFSMFSYEFEDLPPFLGATLPESDGTKPLWQNNLFGQLKDTTNATIPFNDSISPKSTPVHAISFDVAQIDKAAGIDIADKAAHAEAILTALAQLVGLYKANISKDKAEEIKSKIKRMSTLLQSTTVTCNSNTLSLRGIIIPGTFKFSYNSCNGFGSLQGSIAELLDA